MRSVQEGDLSVGPPLSRPSVHRPLDPTHTPPACAHLCDHYHGHDIPHSRLPASAIDTSSPGIHQLIRLTSPGHSVCLHLFWFTGLVAVSRPVWFPFFFIVVQNISWLPQCPCLWQLTLQLWLSLEIFETPAWHVTKSLVDRFLGNWTNEWMNERMN